MAGCCANATPAIAEEEGWVTRTRLLAAPATSARLPNPELPVVTPAKRAVPVSVISPAAKGVPAMGRTRTFCQVKALVTPEVLLVEIFAVSVEIGRASCRERV